MQSKEILFSDNARSKLYSGAKKLADAVKVTMGPRGRNVLLQRPGMQIPHITKDGVSVAEDVFLSDPIENMGAQLIKNVASKIAEDAGDGTTTGTVLAHAIFKEGLRNVTAGSNPIELKRGMDNAVKEIVNNLKEISTEIKSKDQIRQIATISANSDNVIGSLIADAMDRVGKEGVITVEEAKGIDDELEIVEGLQFNKGYLSPYFVTNPSKMEAVLKNPRILLSDIRLTSVRDIVKILENCQEFNDPLLIIAEDVDPDALNTLVVNNLRNTLQVVVVKAPAMGSERIKQLEDIAILTDGKVVSDKTSTDYSTLKYGDLGKASKVIVNNRSCTIIGGKGDPEAIKDRIETIKADKENQNEYIKEICQQRIAKMLGGVAILRVGAASEAEMKEKKDRVDDALASTRAAIDEGIVPGGGSALIKACYLLTPKEDITPEQLIGFNIVLDAIKAPCSQIAENAGFDSGVVINKILEYGDNYGFDASTGEYVDMLNAGIIDPTKVERIALQQAVSVASLLLTTEATISEEVKE